MGDVRPQRVFRVTGAVTLLVVCAAVTVALLADAWVRSGIVSALLLAPWLLLILWVIYAAGVASDIRADDAGAWVQNLLRRTWLPWSRVQRLAMRWQLEFTLDDGKIVRCFGGPVRSRSRRLGPERTKEHGNADASDGIAKLHRLRAGASASPDVVALSGAAVVRKWDWAAILSLVVIVGWAAIAISVTP